MSNHDRSIDPAVYQRARALILDDVMLATSHAPVDSTALAIDAVARKLDDTPWTMWDELGLMVLTLKPVDARVSLDEYGDATTMWVSKHESAQRIREANYGLSWTTVIVNPYEIIQSVEAQHPAVIDLTDEGTPDLVTNGGVVLDWKTIPADAGHRAGTCGWDDLATAVLEAPRRNRRRLLELVAMAVVAAVVFFAAARQAGAVEGPSCSLHVIEVEDDAIVWGYTPPDGVLRGVFLPGGAWVGLNINGRTRTPIVTEVAYPERHDRIVVADLIAACGPHAPATTTTSAPVPTTTTAPEPTTTTTSTPSTTTTAKARPAVSCPAGSVLAFTHHGDPDENGVWTFRVVINGVDSIAGSGDRTWIATWPVPEGGVTVETDDDIEVTCSTVPPAVTTSTSTTPTVPEPPTTSVTAVTPAPFPPATVATPPATTASVPPPASPTPPGLVGGELPRTGVEMRHLPLLVLALITAGALITLAVDRKES